MDESSLPKAYDPATLETRWYKFWEDSDLFCANSQSKKPPFCIVIPPPNVTGVLHMGHALVNTLQDVLIRWKRMRGFEALWIPGTDHAGIATQAVVERHLMATLGRKRYDFSRDEFVKLVWEWKEKYEERIIDQLKKMGCSCDWSRKRFTMDERYNLAVKTLFKKLFDDGLIYRGNYLVNWDPVTQTALADDEVEYEERESSLWFFKYPLKDEPGYVIVATTRPETMLGDAAVAISPKDPRYLSIHGKTVILPLMNREIPIIFDNFVDPTFGTGAVKVTPAHDPNDYQIGLHHNLPMINIMTPDARINENGGEFSGMSREEAREAVVKRMKEKGLLEKVEPHTLRVGVSYRSKAVIEPYLSKQWFIKMTPFKDPLAQCVNEGKVKLIPKTWEHTFFHWINNLRDWCISRQLWWGHRIPVWHHKENPEKMICFSGDGVPPEVAKDPDLWVQDNDVLDTWFSSSMWPFATLGWPEKTEDLQKFYPNSTLITGHDILFFWVARMMLMGEYAMEEPPFPETFLHGLIYGKSYWRTNKDGTIAYVAGDERKKYDLGATIPPDVQSKWEKLSKSKGNVIDPLEMIEEYGTDAVRMTLTSIANQSPQIDLDRRRFEDYKNFANKVWNGARFVFLNLEGLTSEEFKNGLDETLFGLEDRWILSRLNRVNKEVNLALENYQFENAAKTSYDFFWKELCAYYLEIVKPILFGKVGTRELKKNKQKLLVILLSNAIRLLHPMAPFISEELFQRMKEFFPEMVSKKSDPYTQDTLEALSKDSVMVTSYPRVLRETDMDDTIEKSFATIEEIIFTLRNIRGEMKIPPQLAIDLFIVDPKNFLKESVQIIPALVKIGQLKVLKDKPKDLPFAAYGAVGEVTLIVPLPSELVSKEKERVEKEKERLSQKIASLKRQLQDESFVSKAKPEVIQKQKDTLAVAEKEFQILEQRKL